MIFSENRFPLYPDHALARIALQNLNMPRHRLGGDGRPVVRNDAIPERAIDDVVLPTVKALGNGAHGFLAERYEIRIAPHETDEFPVGRYLQQIARQQRAFVAGALRPVHRRAAFEVTADTDERETRR